MSKKKQNLEFLEWMIGHSGNACVTWPFSRNEYGYGQVAYDGKIQKAHRVMCILAHGEPPEPWYNAAHSCGNGNQGCINPNHLSWKTPTENALDTVRDGRARPAGRPWSKLSPEQVAQIREIGATRSRFEIAEQFGVGPETVRRILKGEVWKSERGDSNRRFPSEVRSRMVETAKRLRDGGASLDKIAGQLGISRGSVRNYISEH